MGITEQFNLQFEFRPAFGARDFLVASSNRDAVSWIDCWPNWSASCLIVYGPSGCGKTHLSEVFRDRSNARLISHLELADNFIRDPEQSFGAWILEDADTYLSLHSSTPLFHLFNQVQEGGGSLLISARLAPARWPIHLNDLRSRINASLAVSISPPDDELLAAVLFKHFSDRQLRVSANVVVYAVKRIERSFRAITKLVESLDHLSLTTRREITVPLVRQVLMQNKNESHNSSL